MGLERTNGINADSGRVKPKAAQTPKQDSAISTFAANVTNVFDSFSKQATQLLTPVSTKEVGGRAKALSGLWTSHDTPVAGAKGRDLLAEKLSGASRITVA